MFARRRASLRAAIRNDLTLRAVRATYPALNWARGRRAYYSRVAPYLAEMTFDDVRFSNRGNEPEAHLRRTQQLIDLRSADVLVVGAGKGDELALWKRAQPRSLTATDFFPQPDPWRQHNDTSFGAMDVRALAFRAASFDLVASTALLEHVDGVEECMREMARVSRPGGLVFANFGPLFRTCGGAHFFGSYEHLLMSDGQFEAYLVERAIPYEQQEALFWLRNGMFSRLAYDDYLAIFRRHFDIAHLTLAVSPQALRYKREQPEVWRRLREQYDESDLLTFGATVWLRPRRVPVSIAPRGRAVEPLEAAS